MEVTNCRECGRLFNYISGPRRCPECQKKLEQKFQNVKEFLRQNPDSSISKTATENDVSVKQIKQWIREERLVISNGVAEGIICENCGKPINTGRYCEACKKNMMETLSSAYPSRGNNSREGALKDSFSKENDKMRYLK